MRVDESSSSGAKSNRSGPSDDRGRKSNSSSSEKIELDERRAPSKAPQGSERFSLQTKIKDSIKEAVEKNKTLKKPAPDIFKSAKKTSLEEGSSNQKLALALSLKKSFFAAAKNQQAEFSTPQPASKEESLSAKERLEATEVDLEFLEKQRNSLEKSKEQVEKFNSSINSAGKVISPNRLKEQLIAESSNVVRLNDDAYNLVGIGEILDDEFKSLTFSSSTSPTFSHVRPSAYQDITIKDYSFNKHDPYSHKWRPFNAVTPTVS